jgi:enamine deaminase RidA (YjgF/YER057c/UK114 family)
LSARLRELGWVLPTAPRPLGAYVTAAETGNLLFLSGMLPLVGGKLAITGRLGATLTVSQGQEAARIAALNALAVAEQHFGGNLDRLERLVKLTVLMATNEEFVDHAAVADGASTLFAQLFGPGAADGHVRLVYGVQSLPLNAPLIVDTVFAVRSGR